jgi:hypothetical protein
MEESVNMKPAVVLPFFGSRLPVPVPSNQEDDWVCPDAIKTELSKIFKSDGFVHAERMRRFLEFVVEETLAGRSSQLCEYSIAISVFKRDASFEPGIDPIVRNDARRLRQKLLEYYHQSCGDDNEVVISMPKGGYVPVFRRPRPSSKNTPQHRLTITLTRIKDGAEIWATHYEY